MLIKEVKTLRAQVEALTNERNVQASQFRVLREALGMSVGSNVSNSGTNGNTGSTTHRLQK